MTPMKDKLYSLSQFKRWGASGGKKATHTLSRETAIAMNAAKKAKRAALAKTP